MGDCRQTHQICSLLAIRENLNLESLALLYMNDIVRLHENPVLIVSDRDPRFTSRFWKGFQKAWGTKLNYSTTFHPQFDGQLERTVQTLEDMLRACALEWYRNWDDYLPLVEFVYNNSWQSSIDMVPFEELYGRKCRTPICWNEVGEKLLEGPDLVQVTTDKETRSSLRYLLREAFSDSVRRYPLDAFREDLSYEEEADAILAREERVLRKNTIPFVKILWKNHDVREATWETEDSVRARYPYLFESGWQEVAVVEILRGMIISRLL
ncbi:uncharacterized protein LOC141690952 [Apium graveolens]|uniref:uncharacterized protein LOC141690952 n=1 Tax=Apium graveolens TaxID=4045 RepID=UPI003D7A9028